MRILIVRLGAFGDSLITTPLVKYLHNQGNEIYYLTSDSGMQILKNNPYVAKLIHHKTDSIPNDKLGEYFKSVAQAYECDKYIDLCESIECNLCFHPLQPQYNYTKKERAELADKNYYTETFKFAGYDAPKNNELLRPEMFFTEEEKSNYARFKKDYLGKKIIIWALSGSALHKSYPYTFLVMSKILMMYPEVIFITTGDLKCQILEQALRHERVIHKSAKWTFREASIATKYASAIVSPDTGLLHVSGCYKTPKIGLFTATTIRNVTQYFLNDYSIQSDMACSPCFRLIYNAQVQCNLCPELKSPMCAAYGINPELVIERIQNAIGDRKVSKLSIM